jgi:hypothetical protein
MPGKLVEDPSLRKGEKTLPNLLVDARRCSSMRPFRARISPANYSATMREATSCAGRVTLWDLAAARALCAALFDPLTPRLL